MRELRREARLARITKALASSAAVTDIAEAEGMPQLGIARSELTGGPTVPVRALPLAPNFSCAFIGT
jgi:hypothetical protein